jgi:hypothetical protein
VTVPKLLPHDAHDELFLEVKAIMLQDPKRLETETKLPTCWIASQNRHAKHRMFSNRLPHHAHKVLMLVRFHRTSTLLVMVAGVATSGE